MKRSWLLPLAAITVALPALAGPHYRYVHAPSADVYFGHVSYCETKGDGRDPQVVRDERTEPAAVNFPLAPGNAVHTTPGRRCEVQFDTGTVLRLDETTALRIESILAPSLSTNQRLTNLQLEAGRVHVLYRDYDSSEVFQVLTPGAAVKLIRAAVADVAIAADGATRVGVHRGKVAVLYGPRADRTRSRTLKAGEQATVGRGADELSVEPKAESSDAFASWNRDLNKRFGELHEGKSKLPKPLLHYPPAVIKWAQEWADPWGEWIWSDLYGYMWRPYRSSDAGWARPYQLGHWVHLKGQQFWVPQEPWGWVPYHLGLWHWDAKHGWVWIPGSAFAPAWVAWNRCDDLRWYRPLSLWDWYWWSAPARTSGFYRSAAAHWGYGSWYGYAPGTCGYHNPWGYSQQTVVVAGAAPVPAPTPLPADDGEVTPIRPGPEVPVLPLPKELARVAERFAKAIGADPALAKTALEQTHASAGLLPREPLIVEAPLRPAPAPGRAARFLDWNYDVKAARVVGGHIVYEAGSNSVSCEGCSRPLERRDLSKLAGWADGRNDGHPAKSGTTSSTTSDPGAASTGASAAAAVTSQGGENVRDRIKN